MVGIDVVVEETPCDVVVAKLAGTDHPERVLVPSDGGPHAERAESIAAAFAEPVDGSLTLLTVTADDGVTAAYLDERRTALAARGVSVDAAIVENPAVAMGSSNTQPTTTSTPS